MTWLKLDDSFAEHPKVIELSDGAFRLHVSVMCYCARNPSDGVISTNALKAHFPRAKRFMVELLRHDLWEAVEGGYSIHDFLEYNPSAAKKKATSEARAESGRLGGQRSGEVRREAKQISEANGKQIASRLLEPRPVPSRPDDSLRSSSSDDDAISQSCREMRDTILGALGRYANDPETFAEAELFAKDYEGQWDAFNAALTEVRRTPNMRAFPSNLRKFMPSKAKAEPAFDFVN